MDLGETHHTRWFYPGIDPEDGVPGSYRVNDDGSIEVHVFETWDGGGSLQFVPDESFPRTLMGEVFREAVTLVGCVALGGKTGVTSQQDVHVRPEYAVEGDAYLNADEDLYVTGLRIRLTDQDAWTGWDPFAVSRAHRADGLQDAHVSFDRPADREAQLEQGLLRLVDDSYVLSDPVAHTTTLHARSRFELAFDVPLSIPTAMAQYGYPLQVLLLTATGRMPGAISVRATNAGWFEGAEDATRFHGDWMTIRRFHGGHAGLPPSSPAYLHRLEDFEFGRQLPLVIASVTRHRHAFESYAELLAEHAGGNLSRFVALTRVIDSFDRANHPGEGRTGQFRVRAARLDDEVNGFIASLLPDVMNWSYYVGELRNIVVHGDPRAGRLAANPQPLFAAYEALTLLFEHRLLVEFGFSTSRARELVEMRHPFWQRSNTLIEQFPALLQFVSPPDA